MSSAARFCCCVFLALLWPLAWVCGDEGVVPRVIRSTAFVEASTGNGSAWVADLDRKILITNFHVVAKITRQSVPIVGQDQKQIIFDEVVLFFPAYREDGSLITERKYYERNAAALAKSGRLVTARVVDADMKRDLAVLQATSLPTGTTAIPLAARSQNGGDEHFAIGSPAESQLLWLFTGGKTKSRGHQEWRSRNGDLFLHHAAQVLLTEGQTNPGDSGGPVVNKSGELVAVTQGLALTAKAIHFAIDVSEVREYLKATDWMTRVSTAKDFRRLGAHYLQQGRTEAAIGQFEQAIVRRGNDSSATNADYLDLAVAYREAGRYDDSLTSIAKAMAEKARVPGRAYAERAATRLARIPMEAFLPAVPRTFFGFVLRPRASDDPAFVRSMAKAQREHDQKWGPIKAAVLDDVVKALNEDPKSVLALRTRANFVHRQVFADRVQEIADRTHVVQLLPGDTRALLERANTYFLGGLHEEGIDDCREVIRLSPRSLLGHQWLSEYLISVNQFKEALDVALRFVEPFGPDQAEPLEPENPIHYETIARIAFAQKNRELSANALGLAIERSENLLKRNPLRRHYVDRAEAYIALGEKEKARQDLKRALAIADDDADLPPMPGQKPGKYSKAAIIEKGDAPLFPKK